MSKLYEHSPAEVKEKSKLAKTLAAHHFKDGKGNLEFKPAGRTNFVFELKSGKESYIIRIAASASRIKDFLKEQWACHKAKEHGIPVAEILEVGNEIIPLPYMIQKKIDGKEAVDHPHRLDILKDLGKYTKKIHEIPTSGFGVVFDWSKNRLSKNKTWAEFLDDELRVGEAIKFIQDNNLISPKKTRILHGYVSKIRKWKVRPALNHCDLRLKNVIVNEEGKILAIIDWENCSSNVAPYWDLSIALHDLSIDGKQKFLEGYCPDFDDLNRHGYALSVFNLVNYVRDMRQIMKGRNKTLQELYRLRLNGTFDLFSF